MNVYPYKLPKRILPGSFFPLRGAGAAPRMMHSPGGGWLQEGPGTGATRGWAPPPGAAPALPRPGRRESRTSRLLPAHLMEEEGCGSVTLSAPVPAEWP